MSGSHHMQILRTSSLRSLLAVCAGLFLGFRNFADSYMCLQHKPEAQLPTLRIHGGQRGVDGVYLEIGQHCALQEPAYRRRSPLSAPHGELRRPLLTICSQASCTMQQRGPQLSQAKRSRIVAPNCGHSVGCVRAAQVSSARGGAWLVFSRLPSPEGGGDSWCFTAILQKDVELIKGYCPAVRPGNQAVGSQTEIRRSLDGCRLCGSCVWARC